MFVKGYWHQFGYQYLLQTILDTSQNTFQSMAKQKGGNFKENFYNEFDNFDEQELEMQYGVKVQNKGRTPKKQKKLKFDGDYEY